MMKTTMNTEKNMNKSDISPCLLVILDGWGIGKPDTTNALFMANIPFFDKIQTGCPHTQLACSGEAVGLQIRLRDSPHGAFVRRRRAQPDASS